MLKETMVNYYVASLTEKYLLFLRRHIIFNPNDYIVIYFWIAKYWHCSVDMNIILQKFIKRISKVYQNKKSFAFDL